MASLWWRWGDAIPQDQAAPPGADTVALLDDGQGGRVLWSGDVRPELRRWAAWCALAVADLWDQPIERRVWLMEAARCRPGVDRYPASGVARRIPELAAQTGQLDRIDVPLSGGLALQAAHAAIKAHELETVHASASSALACALRSLEAASPDVQASKAKTTNLGRDLDGLLLDAAAAGILARHAPRGLTAAARAGDVAATAVAYDLALTLEGRVPELVPELVAAVSRWRPDAHQ